MKPIQQGRGIVKQFEPNDSFAVAGFVHDKPAATAFYFLRQFKGFPCRQIGSRF
jgi:hypothetical protein